MGIIDGIFILVLVACMVWAVRGIFMDQKAPVGTLIYIASPFSHKDSSVEYARYEEVVRICSEMFGLGKHVMSPIAHCYSMFEHGEMPGDFEFWREYNYAVLSRCSELWVVMLDGWKDSIGVQGELEFARKRGIPARFVHVNEDGNWKVEDAA